MPYTGRDDYFWEYNYGIARSESIDEMLLTEDAVNERLSKGENPVDLSIDKWNRIEKAYKFVIGQNDAPDFFVPSRFSQIAEFIGARTCALCLSSVNKHSAEKGFSPKYRSDKCAYCPLNAIDCCYNTGSAFSRVRFLLTAEWPYQEEHEQGLDEIITDQPRRIEVLGAEIALMCKNLKSLKG